MATVLDEILASFYKELSDAGALDPETLKALRALFDSGGKLKADELVAVLSSAAKQAPR